LGVGEPGFLLTLLVTDLLLIQGCSEDTTTENTALEVAVGHGYDGTPVMMALAIAGTGLFSLLVYLSLIRGTTRLLPGQM